MSQPHYCYILKNDLNNRTYNGYTNNLTRRLRQHNGEIVGGARQTARGECRPWSFCALLTGFQSYPEALSCEWRIKYPVNRRKKYSMNRKGAEERIASLNDILNLDTWTSKSTGVSNGEKYTLYVDEIYAHLIDESKLPSNVEVHVLGEHPMFQTTL